MSEQVTCGCLTGKACERWAVVERAGTLVWEYLEGYGEQKGYCRHCHAELSFSASGQPVAAAMVPKAALEVVAEGCMNRLYIFAEGCVVALGGTASKRPDEATFQKTVSEVVEGAVEAAAQEAAPDA